MPLIDRSLYPEDKYPYGQWDYQVFYLENFARASAGFEADVRATVRALFRAGNPDRRGKPDRLALVRANGGWFGPENKAPARPRDERVIGEEAEFELCRGALAQRIFWPRQLVPERRGQRRLRRPRPSKLAPQNADAVFARRL